MAVRNHRKSYCRQDLLMGASNSESKFEEKWDIYIVSKYLPQDSINYKRKNSNFRVEKSSQHYSNKVNRFKSSNKR